MSPAPSASRSSSLTSTSAILPFASGLSSFFQYFIALLQHALFIFRFPLGPFWSHPLPVGSPWVLWMLFVCFLLLLVRSVPLLGVLRFARSHCTAVAAAPARSLRRHSLICLPCRFSLCLLLVFSFKGRGSRSLLLSLGCSVHVYSFVRLWAASAFAVPFSSASILFRHSWVCACRAVFVSNDMHPGHCAVDPNSSTISRVMWTLLGTGTCLSFSNLSL